MAALPLAPALFALSHARGLEPAPAQGTPDAQRRNAVVASFKGGQLTVGDVEDALVHRTAAVREHFAQDGGKSFLREIVDYELLIREAERRGYGDHFAVVHATRRAAIDEFVREDLALPPGAISDTVVQAYYREHEADFSQPERRRATLIKQDSKAEAAAVRAELVGQPRTAASTLARERSTDEQTRRVGGELGYFDREGATGSRAERMVDRPTVDAAFGLDKVGDVSQPFAYQGGYAVLMLTALTPGRKQPLEAVAEQLRHKLTQERQKAAIDALVAKLKGEHLKDYRPAPIAEVVPDPAPRVRGIPAGASPAPRDPRAPPVLVPPEEDDL